ncbi:hypothetical protein HK097_000372, partial [Rhizophlyctis rosea]
MKNEAPPIPHKWFRGLHPAFTTSEEFFVNNVGLDAVMFLRFLKRALYIILMVSAICLPILLPINYHAAIEQELEGPAVNGSEKSVGFRSQTLAQYSIAFIPDESPFFWAHIFCAYVVSGIVYYMLFTTYRDYVDLVTNYIHQEHGVLATRAAEWRKWEILQLRTILVQNIPRELQSDEKLKEWFMGLGIGEVDVAAMDRDAGQQLRKLMDKRDKTLKKLEHGYIDWLINIDRERSKRDGKGGRRWYGPGRIMQLHSEPLDISQLGMDDAEVRSLRPLIRTSTNLSSASGNAPNKRTTPRKADAIDHYTDKLSSLTVKIKQLRQQVSQPTPQIQIPNKDPTPQTTAAAFITFKTQRATQIAVQVLLHSSSTPWSMCVRLAPAPQDVLWPYISMPYLRRRFQNTSISIISVFLCLFWIVPTSIIATLTALDSLARVPAFRWVVGIIARSEMVYVWVQTLGPPVVLSLFNAVMPFILEWLSYQQALESNSHVEMATMDKYFFFLFFNVFFVFTLADTLLKIIGNFFENPISIITLVSTTLPGAATFFINYIILNLILFPLELLRPQILFVMSVGRFFLKTPREFHDLDLYTSYLNYGILYPMHVIIFVIILCYSVIAPLILIPGIFYFAIAWVVYRNQLLFVYIKEWESFGRHFVKAFRMVVAGLGVSQVTLAGMLGAKRAQTGAILMIPLICSTIGFFIYCRRAFEKRTYLLPLDQFDGPEAFDYAARRRTTRRSNHHHRPSQNSSSESVVQPGGGSVDSLPRGMMGDSSVESLVKGVTMTEE